MSRLPNYHDAHRLCAQASDAVLKTGYLLAIYGSVMTRWEGQDIDVLLIPWRFDAQPNEGFGALVSALQAQPLDGPYEGVLGTYCRRLVWDTFIVDVQIRGVIRVPGLSTGYYVAPWPDFAEMGRSDVDNPEMGRGPQ